MTIFKTKESVCRKLGITPESLEAKKYATAFYPVLNWQLTDQMFYAALRSGNTADESYQVIADFHELFLNLPFPLKKADFHAKREQKAQTRKSKPDAPVKKQISEVDRYLERHRAAQFKEQNPGMLSALVKEVKERLKI